MGLRSTLAILLAVIVPIAQGQPARPIKGYEKLQAWARSVHEHTPGQWDDPARAVAALSLQDYREMLADLVALKKLLADRGGRFRRYDWPVPPGSKPRTEFRELHLDEVPAILGLPEDPRLRRERTDFDFAVSQLRSGITRFMKVAAVLEADVAIFAPPRLDVSEGFRRPDGVQHYIMKAADGSALGNDAAPIHWTLGSAALDLVAPSPVKDEFVRLWYRATVAHQEQRRQYGYARPHLGHALEVLPDDPYLHFYSGVMLENIAAPPVQVTIESLAESRFYSPGGSAKASLTNAEAALRRALALDPTLAMARLRLGRVVGLRGRHDEAARVLRGVLTSLTRDVDRYYAHLFLGAEEQSLNRLQAAQAAYREAAALFPNAQSPLLSLSQLAWQQDDPAVARTAFLALADLMRVSPAPYDPWWDYDIAPVADAPELLAQVRLLGSKEREQLR
jgi:tetratricopeptide (TPR) repeat protein